MDNQFNIEKLNRRTPYQVPQGFHENLRAEVQQQLFGAASAPKPKNNVWRKVMWPAVAVAVSVAVFLVVKKDPATISKPSTQQVMLNNLCQAYDNLSADDQSYYMEMYSDETVDTEL